MLQTQTVVPNLLELLKKIMKEDLFKDFFLVGGTSLSLQIGHRNSIDIDLFGNSKINQEVFTEKLKTFGNVIITQSSNNLMLLNVNGVKVDFVNYTYPLLESPLEIDGIRMHSKKDIAAMKLNAIAGRGSKKDFIDLYFLLNEFSLKQILNFHKEKYHDGSEFLVIKSLSYFEDANSQLNPKMFLEFNWEKCKEKIIEEVKKLQ